MYIINHIILLFLDMWLGIIKRNEIVEKVNKKIKII